MIYIYRLPHKDGPKYKVRNPLAKDFLDMFSQNVLAAQGNEAEKVSQFTYCILYYIFSFLSHSFVFKLLNQFYFGAS